MTRLLLILLLCVLVPGALYAAQPAASITPSEKHGMDMTNVGDGEWTVEKADGRECWRLKEGSKFLYYSFDYPGSVSGDAWVVVDAYYSGAYIGFVELMHVSSSSLYNKSDGFGIAESGVWRRYALRMNSYDPEGGTMNYGNRLRLSIGGGDILVSRVEIYNEEPDMTDITDPNEFVAEKMKDITPAPAPGMSYCFGNNVTEAQAVMFRSLGVTSIESYVTWESVEGKEKDTWDWSQWDHQVKILQKYGLKWVPFLIVSPAYSTPGWFRASEEHVPCRCLEHGIDSKIESLWNPYLKAYIRRFLEAFEERYGKTGVIESVLLGIQGDFGEAIYSVSGGGWTFNVPGEYHNHLGFWCGDGYAREDFRQYVQKKYGTVGALNKAWHTSYSSFGEADYPFNSEAEIKAYRENIFTSPDTRRRYLDFTDWYRGSMTDLSEWWIKNTREVFGKDTDIYLCTGGHSAAELGGHFADQCRVAAKYGAGVRITNEGSDYALNLTVTRWVASSGKFYGALFGFEPAGTEDFYGIPARIYNATASGADQLHDYNTNVIGSEKTMDQQRKHFKYLFHTKPVVPIALWYPDVQMVMKWDDFLKKAEGLRDMFDFDFVDESMARRGALGRNKVLVIAHGYVMENDVAKKLAAWAKQGGRIIVMDVDRFQSVEGTSAPEDLLFPEGRPGGQYGKGYIYSVADREELKVRLTEILWKLGYPVYEIAENGLFVTQIEKDRLLVYSKNEEDRDITINYKGKKTVVSCEGKTITDIKL